MMNVFKKLFNKKNNLIISVVALIECIILLGLTTYSWIESASSLVIKGNDLPIAETINYRFDVKEGATNMVDLSTYFRPTALYQFAQASSPDGKNFYFKKQGASAYRKGDTTDFNTSYYNIDFQIHNETSKTYNYYFDKADIFKVTSDKITDESVLKVAQGAFRIAVTAGTNSSNTRIYSRDNAVYGAINNIAGNSAQEVNSTGLSTSQYNYQNNPSADYNVFSTTHGGDDTKVNIKIWFEEKDPSYQALSDANKKDLLGATVSIDLKFVNSASNFQTFFFEDYTFSTLAGHEGQHVTTEDQSKKMYFYYSDGTTTSIVPMTTTTSVNESTRWVTCSDDGNPTPRIPDDMRQDLENNPSRGYFFYGTVNSTGNPTVSYRWNITSPAVNDGNIYIYKALSVTKISTGSVGYGVWDNTPIQLFYFKDQTTHATEDAYNANGYQFVKNAGQGRLYLNSTGTATNTSTRMYYDSESDLWMGYYPVEFDNSGNIATKINYVYLSADILSTTNIKVKWSATTPESYDDEASFIYKALGYEGTGLVNSQSSSVGIGTWGLTEKINFSTELVDASIDSTYRYKINASIGGQRHSYYMSKDNNDLQWFAYIPQDAGNTASTYLSFERYASITDKNAGSQWNTTKTLRDGSAIFYATDMATTNSMGQWHIAVVVDGSADNVINDILTTVEGSKLEYSIDGGSTYKELKKLDNYRWYTENFDSTVETINYRWTAYTGEGVNSAVFTYGHDLKDGIYFNITE